MGGVAFQCRTAVAALGALLHLNNLFSWSGAGQLVSASRIPGFECQGHGGTGTFRGARRQIPCSTLCEQATSDLIVGYDRWGWKSLTRCSEPHRCGHFESFALRLRGRGSDELGPDEHEDSDHKEGDTKSEDENEEPITDEDIIKNTLMQKLGIPRMEEEDFLRAREATLSGNETLFQELREKARREEEMTEDERKFWRMERYAFRWPPPWLARMQPFRQLGNQPCTKTDASMNATQPLMISPFRTPVQDKENPVVFLDIAIRALDRRGTIEHEGRVTIELFSHQVPKTAENFRCFCTGEVLDPREYRAVGYKGSIFHRIVKGFLVQGGDFVRFDGTGCYSIYGGMQFADENLSLTHSPGTVAMANTGEVNSNGCQFFIVTADDASFLDGRHVVVGHVVHGMDTVSCIEQVPTIGEDHRPLRKVVVEECGMLMGPIPPHVVGL